MTESFVTQCPHCQTRFRVTRTQLGMARGAVRCGACLQVFNAAEQLARSAADATPAPQAAAQAATGTTAPAASASSRQLQSPDNIGPAVTDFRLSFPGGWMYSGASMQLV